MNNQIPQVNQIVKTKSGDKTWKVNAIRHNDIVLVGVTNGKVKFLSKEQFLKSWRII